MRKFEAVDKVGCHNAAVDNLLGGNLAGFAIETLPDDYYKEAAFCSMCGPKFCSMNYSSKVDEYNKQVHGIEKKDYSELVERLVSIK